MRSAAIALAALTASLLVPSSTVLAQELPQPGQRVRVTSGVYHRVVSTVQAISADSLVIKPDEAHEEDIYLAMAQVSLLETRAQKSYSGVGGLVGLLGGMVVGGAIGAALCETSPSENFGGLGLCLGQSLWGATIGGVVLGVTGWLIGGSIKSDRWQAVPLDNVDLSFVPQRDGRFTLGVSVSF